MLQRIVMVERHEAGALLASFCYFFFLLCGYYVLRPVRDEMGILGGLTNLPRLLSAVFVVMLLLVPLFGWLSSRFPRRVLLPAVYGFFIVNLLMFAAAMPAIDARLIAPVFFVWVNVFNLFVVSVFWSFMVDIYSEQQAERLFGFVSAGGGAGALAGPTLTSALALPLGTSNLLLLSAALLGLALLCIYILLRWAEGNPGARGQRNDAAIGGSIWAGVSTVMRSPYLLGICAYMLLYSLLFSFVYLEQARMMAQSIPESSERIRMFATLDLATNVLALLAQVFVVGRLFKWIGVGGTLMVLPVLAVVGFVTLGAIPALAVIFVFQALRRAAEYAIAKPARELLFTVLDREQKYKSKNFMDTVVFRGTEAASGWLYTLAKAMGATLGVLSFAAVPFAIGWAALGWLLGRKQQAMVKGD